MKKYPAYLCFVFFAVLVAAEAYLRITGKYDTFPESIGKRYTTYYNDVFPTWYFVNKPNKKYTPENSDFQYPYQTNSLGLREKEFGKQKKDSSIRIFVTGDSFAEGQGAPYDSTWVHLLGTYLAKDSVHAEVLNTGVAGSDPVYNYVFHRDVLKGYQSDYIFVCINYSDFTDYLMRGGLERFRADGTTHYRKGPWYEPLYHYSYFARGVIEKAGQFPFRGMFTNEQDFLSSADQAMECYSAVIDSFNTLAKAGSSHIVVVLFSTPLGIGYNNNMNRKFRQCFAEIQQKLAKKNIACINIWDDLKQQLSTLNYLQYSYPHDPHFNPYGYNVMARIMERRLLDGPIIAR